MTFRSQLAILARSVPACVGGTIAKLPEQAQPRTVAELEGFSEGIVWNARGGAFVSLPHRGAACRIPTSGTPVLWYQVLEPNGHEILADDSHRIAAHGGIHHVSAEGRWIEVLGSELVNPNDMALDGDGGVYVSVPAATEDDQTNRLSGLYYLDAKRSPQRVADAFCYPNGIVVSPDGRTLVVNDSCTRQILRFRILAPGSIGEESLPTHAP